jgi:hypothetical protein
MNVAINDYALTVVVLPDQAARHRTPNQANAEGSGTEPHRLRKSTE